MTESAANKKSFLSVKTLNAPLYIYILFFAVATTVAMQTTFYMLVATVSYFTLILGLLNRKNNRELHAKLMLTGISIDILVVLVLELSRGAIATTVAVKLGVFQQAHIYTSSIATLIYFPVIYMGYKLLKDPKTSVKYRKNHIKLGASAFIFRTLGYVLMFSLLVKN